MSIPTKTVRGLDFLSKKTVILHPTGSHRSEMKKKKICMFWATPTGERYHTRNYYGTLLQIFVL